jgi:hypothetical protein
VSSRPLSWTRSARCPWAPVDPICFVIKIRWTDEWSLLVCTFNSVWIVKFQLRRFALVRSVRLISILLQIGFRITYDLAGFSHLFPPGSFSPHTYKIWMEKLPSIISMVTNKKLTLYVDDKNVLHVTLEQRSHVITATWMYDSVKYVHYDHRWASTSILMSAISDIRHPTSKSVIPISEKNKSDWKLSFRYQKSSDIDIWVHSDIQKMFFTSDGFEPNILKFTSESLTSQPLC